MSSTLPTVRPSGYRGRMGRKVDVEDLVGATEIGQRLGMDRRSVHQLRRRHADFPDPVVTLESAMVWVWADVEGWVLRTGRTIVNPREAGPPRT